jgi:hypothetical protein
MQKKTEKALPFKRFILSLQVLLRVCENPDML